MRMETSARRHWPTWTCCRRTMWWSMTGATMPMRCCTRMRSGDCTRCSGCNGKPASMSTASSTAAAGIRSSRSFPAKAHWPDYAAGTPEPPSARTACGWCNMPWAIPSSSWARPCWTVDPYSIDQLSDLYHARWGIEERYKVSKRLMEVEDFHGQSERGVKQELYACFTLIAMTRLFANHGEDHVNGGGGGCRTTASR